jgi:hypothetical protein
MIIIRQNFNSDKKNIVDIGPVKIDKKENKWISWPPYTGAVVIIAGVFITLSNKRGRL